MRSSGVEKVRSIEYKSYPLFDLWAKKAFFRLFSAISVGRIIVRESGESFELGSDHEQGSLLAYIDIHRPSAYRNVLLGGSIGSAEAFIGGDWSSPELLDVIRVIVANKDVLDQLDSKQMIWKKWALAAYGFLKKNTEQGSKENISAHYDIGNSFFELFLDKSMMYSSAIYPDDEADIETASRYKLDHICRRLNLQESDHLLEIGTGWGGLAVHAAKYYGCRVTTTTISQEQFEYAGQKVAAEGLEDKITLLDQDYRKLTGQYDKLVSVEMIEAVGHEYYATFFQQCSKLLKPKGQMLLQAITIADQQYDYARKSIDFIQRYIFPGGCLPSLAVVSRHVAQDSDMQIVGVEDITLHYARTLADWRQRFKDREQDLIDLGYDDAFRRLWDFYFCYCEGGFRERSISTVQLLLAKPLSRDLPEVSHDASAG
ncbi:cyclopropane-fatty-acyl-phospholipid synthase family protein [Halieaceae bacterium]|nr:cyclopropane-fatty-acyl-phospholipid synthase family protein [Halieaceae bacterium]